MNIDKELHSVSGKLRAARAFRGMAIGGLCGAGICAALTLLDRFALFFVDWQILMTVFLASGLAGAVIGFTLKIDKVVLADSLDRRLGLRDRLRSALEAKESEFGTAVVGDAEARLEAEKTHNPFPLRLSRWHALAVLLMAVACGLFMLGNTPFFLSESEKKEREELKGTAAEIRRVAKPLTESSQTNLEQERELAQRLEKLAKELERGRLSKKEALTKANELSEQADKLVRERNASAQKSLTAAEAIRKEAERKRLEAEGFTNVDMEQVERSFEELDRESAELSEKISNMEDKLSQGGLSAEERQNLESELEAAKEAKQSIELSKKAKEFLERLRSHPAYKELLEMAKKASESASGEGKQLTQEEIDEMMKRLEELADKYKTDEDLQRLIEELKRAMEECEGACLGAGLGMGLMGLLPGSGVSKDNNFANSGKVNKTDQEQDINATAKEKGVSGQRQESGKETHIEIVGPSAAGERTKTPYTSVLPKYKRSAESAINKQKIPQSQQKRVREYFDSISGGK